MCYTIHFIPETPQERPFKQKPKLEIQLPSFELLSLRFSVLRKKNVYMRQNNFKTRSRMYILPQMSDGQIPDGLFGMKRTLHPDIHGTVCSSA